MKIHTRYLVVRRNCPNCREALRAVRKVNPRLHPERQIIVIENYLSEEFKLENLPIVKKFDKEGFERYPIFYVDKVIIEPAPARLILYTLNGLLKQEYMY